MIAQVDGEAAERSPLAAALRAEGFTATSRGLMKRSVRGSHVAMPAAALDEDEDDAALVEDGAPS